MIREGPKRCDLYAPAAPLARPGAAASSRDACDRACPRARGYASRRSRQCAQLVAKPHSRRSRRKIVSHLH
eukprot:8659449-Pyramimonas_sp.AAC.1